MSSLIWETARRLASHFLKASEYAWVRERLDIPSGSKTQCFDPLWFVLVSLFKQHQAKIVGLQTKGKVSHRVSKLG